MKRCFIVNPAAQGGARRSGGRGLISELNELGDVVYSRHAGHARDLAREAAETGAQVIAVGGDGTAAEAASGILLSGNPQATLGLIPTGTGNDFSEALAVRDARDGLRALAEQRSEVIDVIRVVSQAGGGQPRDDQRLEAPAALTAAPDGEIRVALLFAAVGFSERILRFTTPGVKRIFGRRFSYLIGFLRALRAYDCSRMRLRLDGEEIMGAKLAAGMSNTESAGGGAMRLAPGAEWDDGWLNFWAIEPMSRREVARCFSQLRSGRHLAHPKATYRLGRVLEVECDPPRAIQADGESFGMTPARFEICPKALRVLTLRVRRYPPK